MYKIQISDTKTMVLTNRQLCGVNYKTLDVIKGGISSSFEFIFTLQRYEHPSLKCSECKLDVFFVPTELLSPSICGTLF